MLALPRTRAAWRSLRARSAATSAAKPSSGERKACGGTGRRRLRPARRGLRRGRLGLAGRRPTRSSAARPARTLLVMADILTASPRRPPPPPPPPPRRRRRPRPGAAAPRRAPGARAAGRRRLEAARRLAPAPMPWPCGGRSGPAADAGRRRGPGRALRGAAGRAPAAALDLRAARGRAAAVTALAGRRARRPLSPAPGRSPPPPGRVPAPGAA
jgi:hypothetical protein